MPGPRYFHGCDKMAINGKSHLLVYGGRYYNAQNVITDTNDIMVYNMDVATSTWTPLPGAMLASYSSLIGGGIVKRLTTDACDMMFVEVGKNLLQACSGNYNWTATAMTPGAQSTEVQFVPVGVNYFKNCV